MQIYLPIAEMAVHAEVILLLGLCVGFLSGLFGIGGGFLATPLLIFLGLPPAIVVGSQSGQLTASSLTGVLGYWQRNAVDLRMAAIMLAGSFPGTALGVVIFRWLQHGGHLDFMIPVLYILLLGGLGLAMFCESLSTLRGGKGAPRSRETVPPAEHPLFGSLPGKIGFPRSGLRVSFIVPAAIGVVSGILVSLLGVGSGFLLVPAMIYILGMPAMMVAGTSLFHILITAAVSTVMHAASSHTVDAVLSLLMIVGSVAGAQAGVRVARRMNPVHGRLVLALILLLIGVALGAHLLIPPADIYVTETP